MFFLHYVKSAVENEFEIRFIQFDLFRRKSAFSTQFPLPVKTKARSRDVSGGTKILRNTFPTRTGVTARVSSSRSDDVFSEESDSNALGLVYDRIFRRVWATSGILNNMCRLGFAEAIRT